MELDWRPRHKFTYLRTKDRDWENLEHSVPNRISLAYAFIQGSENPAEEEAGRENGGPQGNMAF